MTDVEQLGSGPEGWAGKELILQDALGLKNPFSVMDDSSSPAFPSRYNGILKPTKQTSERLGEALFSIQLLSLVSLGQRPPRRRVPCRCWVSELHRSLSPCRHSILACSSWCSFSRSCRAWFICKSLLSAPCREEEGRMQKEVGARVEGGGRSRGRGKLQESVEF